MDTMGNLLDKWKEELLKRRLIAFVVLLTTIVGSVTAIVVPVITIREKLFPPKPSVDLVEITALAHSVATLSMIASVRQSGAFQKDNQKRLVDELALDAMAKATQEVSDLKLSSNVKDLSYSSDGPLQDEPFQNSSAALQLQSEILRKLGPAAGETFRKSLHTAACDRVAEYLHNDILQYPDLQSDWHFMLALRGDSKCYAPDDFPELHSELMERRRARNK